MGLPNSHLALFNVTLTFLTIKWQFLRAVWDFVYIRITSLTDNNDFLTKKCLRIFIPYFEIFKNHFRISSTSLGQQGQFLFANHESIFFAVFKKIFFYNSYWGFLRAELHFLYIREPLLMNTNNFLTKKNHGYNFTYKPWTTRTVPHCKPTEYFWRI